MTNAPPDGRITSVLEDPSSRAVARTYADAFLQAAGGADGGADGALGEFTSFHDDVLQSNPAFARLLTGSLANRDEKLAMIDRVVAPRASALFTNFLRVLARHDRLGLLPQILGESHVRRERELGQRRVTVTSAVPLDDARLAQVRARLDAALPFEPVVQPEVDPSLLGGLVIRIGDTVYDTSLRAKLRQLRTRLKAKATDEIQRGRDRFRTPEGN